MSDPSGVGDPRALTRAEVEHGDWVATVSAARDAGYRFFDWLTAVDQSDDELAPGLDVVCHLLDGSTPGALRRKLFRTRVPAGAVVVHESPSSAVEAM